MFFYLALFWLGSLLGYALAVILFSAKASDNDAMRFFILKELHRVIDSADSEMCSDNDHRRESLQSFRSKVERVYNKIEEMK